MRNARVLALFVSIGCLSLAMADSAVDQPAAIQKIKALGGNVERSATGKSNSIVTISLIGCTRLKDEDLAFLNAFPDVTELILAGATGISDNGLKHLARCKELTSLGLARTAVSDEGMNEVAKLKKLERLQLSHTAISDKGITNLRRPSNLQSLVLIGTFVTDEGLKELAEFKGLAVVNVKQSRVTDEGLNWLRNARPGLECELPFAQQAANNNPSNAPALEPQENDTEEQRESLQKIRALGGSVDRDENGNVTDIVLIDCGQLKDEDLSLVKAFPDIRGLYLGRTPIKGDGLKSVSDFKKLQTIGLIGTQMVDESLKHLSKLNQLESLYLANTSITDAGVANLGRLPGLKELLLANSKVTDEALKELAEFPKLETVTLQGTNTSEEALARLREARPNLQATGKSGGGGGREQATIEFKPMEDDPPELIKAAERIKAVGGTLERDPNKKGSPVTDITLIDSKKLEDEDLEFLKLFPDLAFLALGWTNVSNKGVKLVPQCPKLTVLGLIKTRVDDEGLKEVAKLEHLESLFLSITSITNEGIVNLGRLPNLRVIMLAETAITDDGLKELAEFKSLKMVNLARTSVTEEGTRWLREARPDIQIIDGSGGGGGQRGDPEFDTTVANPAYTMSHPAILFDEAHNNFHTASGRYKAFADMITNDGYVITPGEKAFTPEMLARYQILVIANASTDSESTTSAFTSEECECVKEWVKSGGSLLLVTDHEPWGSASADLAKPFGVEMTCRVASDQENETGNGLLFSRENLQIGNHPIMAGRDDSERVNRVLTFVGQSLKGPPDSWQLLRFSETASKGGNDHPSAQKNENPTAPIDPNSAAGECQGSALKFGKGRVVVMGEAAELSAQMIGGNPPDRFGMNVPGCDNRKMAINIIHWLSHLIDPGD
jgi:hypothetical protein